ncbi:MAG: molybdopterin-dependent oxidoreductase [Nitrosomonadales bacterium]|nr:molybdopterin-dependent oxidoreductase [Nitrosomonadales bacterium]
MSETRSTCCYCGVGCGVIIESDGDRISGVRGDPAHPSNFGRLCSKGSTLHLTARPEQRLLQPELRTRRAAPRQPVDWDTALDHAAERFAAIIEKHGPDAVAFYISGQLLTEDYYVFNKLARGVVGTNNVDSNSRLCMSSAVAAYKLTLGSDAPPGCYDDIAHAHCIFIAGSNTAFAHPILFRRIEDARKANPDLKLVVVDPRRTDTAQAADLHLAIQPGSDVMLFNAMLHVMIREGWCDEAYIAEHTENFAAVRQAVHETTPQAAAERCGVSAESIEQAARWFAAGPTLSLYCQGLNQSVHGADKNAALINLHLATGQIGKPGAAPLSLTGQPNAMGGREVGGMANLLSGHRNLADPQHRAEVAALWGVPSIPERPGKTAVELFDALHSGEIKAVWIACTNPAHSMPDAQKVRAALARAEFVVVQEAFRDTDTVPFADLLLPASTWGEKTGTVTNSERRISRVRAAVPPPGEARHDWQIAAEFGQRLAQRLGKSALLGYPDTETIFNEHRASTAGRDLDISGLSYALLEQAGPQQWPLVKKSPLSPRERGEGAGSKPSEFGTKRLYTDGHFPTPSGKAHFHAATDLPLAEDTDAHYPLHLNTGRLRDQWHGMSRTGKTGRLFSHVEEPLLSMHAGDMAQRQLADDDIVELTSRRGALVLRVSTSGEMKPGQVFLPMHWGEQYMHGLGANALTLSANDPYSKQPELKHAAVQVSRLTLPWQVIGLTSSDALARLRALLPQFRYASVGLYGREHELSVFRAAHASAVDTALLAELDAALGLETDSMSYHDAKRGISKKARIEHGKLRAVRLTGETLARDWLKELMASDADATALRPWLLAPLSAPPAGQHARGRIVCNCLDVSENEIRTQLSQGGGLPALQEKLRCGTQCGSCLPELKRLAATDFSRSET